MKERMSVEQLGLIIAMLFKVFLQVSIKVIKGEMEWDVTCGTAQRVINDDSDQFFHRFLKFLANGGRVILGDLKIATAPFNIHAFLGKDWNYWKGPLDGNGLEGEPAGDSRSVALQEVDFAQADFLTCLEGEETSIKGTEKYSRLKKSCHTLYGVTVFMGLWLDWKARGAESVLEKLFQERGITYMDFFGDILRNPSGICCVLYLYRNLDGQWYWNYNWLDNDWRDHDFSVTSQQVSSK